MSKKKTYVQLLKEAIAEFDTSDSVEVKGPMLDPILSWRGDGELPTNKDAAGILERYYFNEEAEKPLDTAYENDKGDAAGDSMEHAEGTGTEQAGTSDESTIKGALDAQEKDIAKEWIENMMEAEDVEDKKEDKKEDKEEEKEKVEESKLFFLEQEDESKETPEEEAAESPAKEKKEKEEGVEESLFAEADDAAADAEDETEDAVEKADEEAGEMAENAIIEKLIDEMEEKDGVMTYTGDEPKVGWPEEKEAKSSEEHAEGSGTEQAGTGDAEGQIPDRKDIADQMVKPKEYTDETFDIQAAVEQLQLNLLEAEEEMEEPKEDEEKEKEEPKKKLDVDKEVAKEAAPPPSAVPGGPSPKKMGEDWDEDEGYYANEGFRIFKEEIEKELNEDVDDISSKDLRV